MNFWIIGTVVFFVILVSIQYSLNKIVILLKEIRDAIYKINIKE